MAPSVSLVEGFQRIDTHPAFAVHLLTPRLWQQPFADNNAAPRPLTARQHLEEILCGLMVTVPEVRERLRACTLPVRDPQLRALAESVLQVTPVQQECARQEVAAWQARRSERVGRICTEEL